jgi:hypothetical protein
LKLKRLLKKPELRKRGEFSKSRYFFKPQFRKELQIFTIHDAAKNRLAVEAVSKSPISEKTVSERVG